MTIEEYREIRKRAEEDALCGEGLYETDAIALLSLVDELAVGWMDDRYDGPLPLEERQRRIRIAEAIVAEGADV